MAGVYGTSVLTLLVVALLMTSLTYGRFIPGADDRLKRQIGDIKTAEYRALIALGGRLPQHCQNLACGLVDVIARLSKRTSSDQRLAELQALIALSRGRDTPIGHGQIDPWRIGRKKRDHGSFYESLSPEQKIQVLNLLLDDDSDVLS